MKRFWSKVKRNHRGCWEWQAYIGTHGYGSFRWKSRPTTAHRHCDNRKCVRPSHLFLGTAGDNIRDAAKKGRLNGEVQGIAKLNRKSVIKIRKTYARGGTTMQKLADRYGVGLKTVHQVIRGITWGWLKEGL